MSDPVAPWRAILSTALLAPSPHNVQPWRVRLLDARRAEVHIEKRRTLPNEDVTGSFIILTMGLFLESIRLAAAQHGFVVEETLLDDLGAFSAERLRKRPEPMFAFARLTLRESPEVRPPFPLELFERRRTSRLAYGPELVTEADRARLAELVRTWGHAYQQTQDPRTIEHLLALDVEAVFEDLNDAPYREELAGWLRYSSNAAARTRDGLEARCMNQHPAELWFAFHLPGILRWPLARAWFARRYRVQLGPVPTLGFLSGEFWDPHGAFRAGRCLIHFWLECTRLGYYCHPYGNLVTHRATAKRVEAAMGIGNIWLAFKIGRSAVPPRSQRRHIEEVLL